MLINDSPLLDWAHHTPKHSPTVFLGRAARECGEGYVHRCRKEFSLREPNPVLIVNLFPELLEVLSQLAPGRWTVPTSCPGWSVHDVALNLLSVDAGELSRERDDFSSFFVAATTWNELVTCLNRQNEGWIESTRGISPRLLCDLLKFTGEGVHRHYASLDSHSLGPEVSCAHPGPAPMWAHMAREYTERWHHQMQIREAVGIELLLQPMFFRPVLATFVHALPRTYSNHTAKAGTVVRLSVLGESGDDWYLGWMRGS